MKVVTMTWGEKRSRMLCHRCWLAGQKVLAVKMIDQQGSLLIEGYEDVVSREIRLGICEACLTSLGLSNKTEVEDMEKSDVIMEELAQLSEQLAACIEKLVRVRSLMFDSVVCEICRERLADSICNCGLDLCTTCEQNHRHMNISQ
jgi:microcompartment protein CcmK/EutM